MGFAPSWMLVRNIVLRASESRCLHCIVLSTTRSVSTAVCPNDLNTGHSWLKKRHVLSKVFVCCLAQ